MALSEASLASLILVLWVFFSNKLEFASDIIKSTADAVMVTDAKGVIHTVNAAFTEVTGYPKEAVIGKTPNILNSGFQDRSFYNAFWVTLLTTGKWQGKIVNRKASGEVFSRVALGNGNYERAECHSLCGYIQRPFAG